MGMALSRPGCHASGAPSYPPLVIGEMAQLGVFSKEKRLKLISFVHHLENIVLGLIRD